MHNTSASSGNNLEKKYLPHANAETRERLLELRTRRDSWTVLLTILNDSGSIKASDSD